MSEREKGNRDQDDRDDEDEDEDEKKQSSSKANLSKPSNKAREDFAAAEAANIISSVQTTVAITIPDAAAHQRMLKAARPKSSKLLDQFAEPFQKPLIAVGVGILPIMKGKIRPSTEWGYVEMPKLIPGFVKNGVCKFTEMFTPRILGGVGPLRDVPPIDEVELPIARNEATLFESFVPVPKKLPKREVGPRVSNKAAHEHYNSQEDSQFYSIVMSNWESEIIFDNGLDEEGKSLPNYGFASNRHEVHEVPKQPIGVRALNPAIKDDEWEMSIIWDDTQPPAVPPPTSLVLDFNDPNMPLHYQNTKVVRTLKSAAEIEREEAERLERIHWKERKKEAERLKVISDRIEAEKKAMNHPDRDPFNIGQDHWYRNVEGTEDEGAGVITRAPEANAPLRHMTLARRIDIRLFPPYPSETQLRTWHRPPLIEAQSISGSAESVTPANYEISKIKKKLKQLRFKLDVEEDEDAKEDIKKEENRLRKVPQRKDPLIEEITSCDGIMVLMEYCEQHPPMLSTIGMATRVRNYMSAATDADSIPDYEYGVKHLLTKHDVSPFLGVLEKGDSLQAVDSKLYRAPLFQHDVPSTDFLLIIRNEYNELNQLLKDRRTMFLRPINSIFAVGQVLPNTEVPKPKGQIAVKFLRFRVVVWIIRFLYGLRKDSLPANILRENVHAIFSKMPESSLKIGLATATETRRSQEKAHYALKPVYRNLTEEQITKYHSPEDACLWESMRAGEQRIMDLGFGMNAIKSAEMVASLLAKQEEKGEDLVYVEPKGLQLEIMLAPWNWTKNYSDMRAGKCQLRISGAGEPTAHDLGVSYLRAPNKPLSSGTKIVHTKLYDTENDQRKWTEEHIWSKLASDFGIHREHKDYRHLKRWDALHLLREKTLERTSAQGEDSSVAFARRKQVNIAEYQQKFKDDCQKRFMIERENLLSKDTGSDADDLDADDDQIDEEAFEAEYLMMMEGKTKSKPAAAVTNVASPLPATPSQAQASSSTQPASVAQTPAAGSPALEVGSPVAADPNARKPALLIIRRTRSDGTTVTEHVTNSLVIERYLQLTSAQHKAKQIRKEKKDKEKEKANEKPASEKKKSATTAIRPSKTTVVCSKCGAPGHARSNKDCPLYKVDLPAKKPSKGTKPSGDQPPKSPPVKRPASTALPAFDETGAPIIVQAPPPRAPKKPKLEHHYEEAEAPPPANDDIVEFIWQLVDDERFQLFIELPQEADWLPAYLERIRNPIDLMTMLNNATERKYQDVSKFHDDGRRLLQNCIDFNGEEAGITDIARKLTSKILRFGRPKTAPKVEHAAPDPSSFEL